MADDRFEPEPSLLPPFADEQEESMPHFLGRMENALEQQEERPAQDEVETAEERFDPDIAEDVMGLIHLGHLTGRFEVMGHTFVLRTLRLGEELAIGQVVNEYAGTVVQGQAYAAAQVAASLMTVDGRPLLAQLGPDQTASIRDKFQYITEKWYGDTVIEIWACYKTLQERQAKAYAAVQGK